MIIAINDTIRIAQTNVCYVIQERRNVKTEFVTTKYYTTLSKALKSALEMVMENGKDTELEVELKNVIGEVNKAINDFVKNMEIRVGEVEQ